MRWQRRARLIIGVIGLAVLVLVALTIRRRPPAESTQTTPVLDPKAVTESTGGRLVLFSGTESPGFIDYKHLLAYADGTSKLIEPCATLSRGGRPTKVCGREARVGANREHMTMTGDVRLSSDDGLTARTEEASYTEKEGVVRAPGRVSFSKGAMTGSSLGMTYREEKDVLSLHERVVVRVKPGEGSAGADITAGRAEYARTDRFMRFEEDVRIVRQGRVITAAVALARLSAGEERIEGLELRDQARIETAGSAPGAKQTMAARDMNLTLASDGETLERAVLIGDGSIEEAGTAARSRRISAEMLDLTFHGTGEMSGIAAREDVELTLPAQKDAPAREITSATMDGTGAPGGGLTAARFGGGVEFRERRGDSSRVARSRTLDAAMHPQSGEIEDAKFAGGVRVEDGTMRTSSAEARYQVEKGVFELRGRQGQNDPRVEDDRLTVEAVEIDVTLDGPRLQAREHVRSVIRPESKKKPAKPRATPGMLKDDQPTYVTAATLHYDGGRSLATYQGDSRLWQGDTTIQGATIVIDEESGNLNVRDSVRTFFVLDEKDEKTGEVRRVPSRASAKEMLYENDHRRATYTTDAEMTGPQGDLESDRIVLYFVEGGGSLERAEAYGKVQLEGDRRSATGDRLTYFADEGRYLMVGAPVRSVEECRETTCKTLTFWRSTDRIVCDGNEENRTLTKSVGKCPEPRAK